MTGPPCSGKTSWVRRQAQADDLILDADDIARRLGSPDRWGHTRQLRDQAQAVMWQQMATVAEAAAGTAWVIRACPDPAERQRLAQLLRATRTVVLLPSLAVLSGRAQARPHPYRTTEAIRWWLRHYQPAPGDELNPGVR